MSASALIPAAGVAGLLALAGRLPQDPARDGQHFTLRARVEPERVLPGGWIDVIAELALDPGWHATSPRSPNGPRASLSCRAPATFQPLGDLLVEGATPGEDPVLGKVELLEGRVELRRRFAVPSGAGSASSLSAELALSVTVCDAFRCLPRRSVEARASFAVDVHGGRLAPAPAQLAPLAPPDEREVPLLAKNGYLLRARQESVCAPGEAAFVVLEFLVPPGSTLAVRALEPHVDPMGEKGFERLPLCLPVELTSGAATLDHDFRAYQVFRTSPELAPGRYALPYGLSALPGGAGSWVEAQPALTLVLAERR